MAGEYLKSSVHVHSKLCDGKNTLDEIAVTAWRNGLQTLGFSGHSHTPCDLEYCMTQSRTALYKAQVAKLKERYAGKLDIQLGAPPSYMAAAPAGPCARPDIPPPSFPLSPKPGRLR
mgnify:CR=1 FL=1